MSLPYRATLRAAILYSLRDVESDLELEDGRVPTLRPCGNTASGADGPVCPTCGSRLIFQSFQRIRPPPLSERGRTETAHERAAVATDRSF